MKRDKDSRVRADKSAAPVFRATTVISAVSAIAAMTAVAVPVGTARAQSGGGPDRAAALDEIVVRGQRLSQQRSIEAKRDSETIVDVVSTDDLGRLPDKNAAEAVDRLPGVSITVDQGEGRFVSIRGINPTLNNLTINGVNAGSPEADDGGRLSPLDVLGSELLRSIEVIKVQTPDLDAQGIGGTVNVTTVGPFDRDERFFGLGSAQVGYEELSDNTPYAAELVFGGRTAGDDFGWLFGASYSFRDFESRGVYPDDWRRETLNGVTASLPENSKNNAYQLERTRLGALGTLEWRPDDTSRYALRAYFSQFDEDEVRQRFEYMFSRDITTLTPTGGVSGTSNRREEDLRLEEKDKRFFNLAFDGENRFAGDWTLDYLLQYNDNRQEEPNRNWEFRGSGYGPDAWSIDGRGFVAIEPGPVDPLDPALLRFRRLRLQDNRTDEEAWIGGADLRRDLAFGDGGSYLKLGFKYTGTERENDGRRTRYNLGSSDWFASDFGHFAGVFTNEVDGTGFPNLRIDPGAAIAFFEANQGDTAFFELDDEDSFESEFQDDYDVTEDILAGYVMGNADFGRWNLLAGVRVEQTEVESAGFLREEDTLTATRIERDGDYTNVLPAVLLRYDATGDLVLRGAWSNTLGRPDYNQIAPISSLSRDGSQGALFIGNPDLEARESANFDLSIEYYFGEGAMLTGSYFYKNIDNFIVAQTESFDDFEFNGELFETFDITTLENATEGEVSGFELNYLQRFDFLPGPWSGIGIALNGAFLDSELEVEGRGKLPLLLQPDWTRSYALFYQYAGFEAALSLDESDQFLADLGGDGATDLWIEEYGRLDFKASYRFGERYDVFVEWQNIDDEPLIEYQGGIKNQITQFEEYGQTWYVGMNVSFSER